MAESTIRSLFSSLCRRVSAPSEEREDRHEGGEQYREHTGGHILGRRDQPASCNENRRHKERKRIIPNPVRLIPYRTFLEVEQPESEFVFRITEGEAALLPLSWYRPTAGRWEGGGR